MIGRESREPAQKQAKRQGQMSFLDHVAELRTRLIKSFAAVFVAGFIAWFFYPQILDFLIEPYCNTLKDLNIESSVASDGSCRLFINNPTGGFSVRFKVAIYGGIALSMPYLMWQIWRFVTPALNPKEKRFAIPFVLAATALFALGAGLAYWSLPRALDFLLTVGGEQVDPLFSPNEYLTFVTFMMLAFGIGFQFPIVLVFLQIAGVVIPQQLSRTRRFSIVGIVTLAAVITPSGDPVTLAALSIPMWMFYELSIVIGRLIVRRRR